MTVLLSFEEKTDEARACAQSFCRYKSLQTLENECAQMMLPLSQRFGHPRVLGIPIPISLAFWASPVGDAQNADHFDFA